MPFVNVRLLAPDGSRFRVDIDSDLSVESVKNQLVQELKLSTDIRYSLQLVNSFKLSQGDELQLVPASDQGIRNLEPEDGQP
jgi:hypothetical protein